MARSDGRQPNEKRETIITRDFIKHAEGSVLIACGDTKVICTASVEDKVPPFLRGQGKGWVTAEYSMIPRSTGTRMVREASKGKLGGRTYEIQRLIGRALRSVVDMTILGERSVLIDCDVIQADGGTRTASITGAFVAMAMAMQWMKEKGMIGKLPIKDFLAAASVGVVKGTPCLDLNYEEDSSADVDMNIVMTGQGKFVEIQGTAEQEPFSQEEMEALLGLGREGINGLIELQKEALGGICF
ncbi:MAG: ribonuclease PH [Nitrospinota bacterium]|nr:ribonuclease PH [Nitrospinota bacterium]